MDVGFFLRERIQFIRQLYLNSIVPFEEKKAKIENEVEPFVPPYSEDEVPAFQAEWQEAEDSIQVLGNTCLSMLSNSLKLYFVTIERNFGFNAAAEFKGDFKKGFLKGYGAFFKERLGIDFDAAPCDLALIEEVVLIRNSFEHPTQIFFNSVEHPGAHQTSSSMFFCRDSELKAWNEVKDSEGAWLMGSPRVHTDKERICLVLESVLVFCNWFDEQLTNWRLSKITD